MTDARLLTLGRRPPSVDAAADNLRQLVQLRWLAVAGQLVTILIVRYRLGVPLPVELMVATVAALAAVKRWGPAVRTDQAPGAHHVIGRHASSPEPAKLLAVFVVDSNDKALTVYDQAEQKQGHKQ